MISEIRIYTTSNRCVSIKNPTGMNLGKECADAIKDGKPIVLQRTNSPDYIINPEYVEVIEIEYKPTFKQAAERGAEYANATVLQLGA